MNSPSSMKPIITNVNVSVDFSCEFDLQRISQSLKNTEYYPNGFPAVILTIHEPKSRAFIFNNGKFNIMGTKTIDEAYISSRKIGKILSKIDFNVKIHKFKVTNIEAKCNCNFDVGLDEIASNKELRKFVYYNKRHYNGLFFIVPDSNVSLYIQE